jgi:hypothetical protein
MDQSGLGRTIVSVPVLLSLESDKRRTTNNRPVPRSGVIALGQWNVDAFVLAQRRLVL